MPTVKEDFIFLFEDEIEGIKRLPQRFTLRDFNFMVTSQRTMDRILEKMEKIDQRLLTGREHGNFWVDLRLMGLAREDRKDLGEFGRAALLYFRTEKDDFKREHFLLSSIRRKDYNIPDKVREVYVSKVGNLQEYIRRVPGGNAGVQVILKNEEKLFFTECLNTFPSALTRYLQLPADRQERLDTLHESGLKKLIEELGPGEEPYAKVAKRFLNVWRALNRRVNFVKSVILSEYEEGVLTAPSNEVPLDKPGPYEGLMTPAESVELLEKSDKVSIVRQKKFVSRGKRRPGRARTIVDPELLTKREWLDAAEKEMPDTTDWVEREQAKRALLERRTVGHQELVKTIVVKLYPPMDFAPKEDPFSFDLLVEKGGEALLHEMKTVKKNDLADERRQVIHATGQLFYYEHFDVPLELQNKEARIVKIAVLEHRPSDSHITYLKKCGIEVLWIEDGEVRGERDSLEAVFHFLRKS